MEMEEITYNWKAHFRLPNKEDAVEITGAYRLIK